MDLSTVKKMVTEPSVYAIIIKSSLGQALYLGVHFTLDEAYLSAQKKFETLSRDVVGEITNNIDVWSSLTARDILTQFIEPNNMETFIKSIIDPPSDVPITGTREHPSNLLKVAVEKKDEPTSTIQYEGVNSIENYIISARTAKNNLMKKIIEDGDLSTVEKLKNVLNSNERRYLISAIEKQSILKLKNLAVSPDNKDKN